MKLTLHLSIAKYAKLLTILILLLGCNVIVAQVEIASQRFNNGNPNYQYTVADKDGIFAPSCIFVFSPRHKHCCNDFFTLTG